MDGSVLTDVDPVLEAEVGVTVGALDLDVALDAGPGEVVAVLGPNGAGKTTLLRALAGLNPLRAGRVVVDGVTLEDPTAGVDVPPERRPVSLVFQGSLLFPHLSALDNVAFGLRATGRRKREARTEAQRWLERLGLGELASASARTLSGGEAQRVALARALAVEPRVLLLDEPLSALDVEGRRSLRSELRQVLRNAAGARLLVTHDPVEAMVLADRLVVLEGGRVVQSGAPVELSRRPRSPYVASLVGLNLYRGQAAHGVVTLDGGGSLTSADTTVDGPAFAAVAPSAVAVHAERPGGSPRNVLEGTVRALDAEGDRVRVRLDGPVPVAAEITPAALADLGLHEGDAAWVAIKATEVTVYAV